MLEVRQAQTEKGKQHHARHTETHNVYKKNEEDSAMPTPIR